MALSCWKMQPDMVGAIKCNEEYSPIGSIEKWFMWQSSQLYIELAPDIYFKDGISVLAFGLKYMQ